jgi:HD-like signal output (HDOD) protein
MQTSLPANLTQWVEFLGHADIPVLRRTSNHLARLRSENTCPGARAVAQIIKQDPLMTVKLLRHLQQHKHQRQAHEVMQAEQALIMLGVENALDQIATESQVEILLHAHSSALVKLLHRTHRAHVAANYAFEWAVRLHDIHFEEIRTAALLHEVTELLLWCYAPTKCLQLRHYSNRMKPCAVTTRRKKYWGLRLMSCNRSLSLHGNYPNCWLLC